MTESTTGTADATERDLTADDVGKPIVTVEGTRIGTVGAVDYPTLYIDFADDVDESLKSAMKTAETTARTNGDRPLAGIPIGAVKEVTDDEVVFWRSYAAE